MGNIKIPFIYTKAEKAKYLADVNLYKTIAKDNNVGFDINFAKLIKGNNKTGLDINGFKEINGSNKSGLDINYIKVVKDNQTICDINCFKGIRGNNKPGLDINLAKMVGRDDNSINCSILASGVGSVNKESLSYATFYNNINKVGDYGFAIQSSIFYNGVEEISNNACVIQFGLSNKMGENYSMFIGCKGLKNIPKIIKNRFKKRKSLEEEVKESK